MLRLRRLAAVFAATLLATGCATTMNVSSHVDRVADFSSYRTFDWGPADTLPTGDPRLDEDPYFQDFMLGAVERQLAIRGFERSPAGDTPDLLIHYHANITQRIKAGDVDRQYGSCFGDACTVDLTEYEAGTLVLDIVDTRTNKVVWRGWAQDSVRPMLENRDTMDQKITEAVTRMLARLPAGTL